METDYDISSLFKSPPQRRRNVRKQFFSEVKRTSERLANKAKLQENKKVMFGGNTSQG